MLLIACVAGEVGPMSAAAVIAVMIGLLYYPASQMSAHINTYMSTVHRRSAKCAKVWRANVIAGLHKRC